MRPETILLVEDNADDVALVRRAFARLDRNFGLAVVGDGQQAINYLTGAGRYQDRQSYPQPALVLLDLKLPILDGFKFLQWRSKDAEFRRVPVVVLAASSYSPDIKNAYAMGANSFVTKPVNFVDLTEELKAAFDYWVLRARHRSSPGQTLPDLKHAA